MMRYKVFTSISLLFVGLLSCNSLGISSKLDFGDTQPKLIGTVTQYRSNPSQFKSYKREEPQSSSDFENIGVVCTSAGCNTTKSTNSNDSKDSIQTDVIVHVQTSVDVNKNKTGTSSPVDDTPDVPVVVGVAGTNFDNRESGFPFKQRPLVVTNIEDSFPSISSTYSPPLRPTFSTPLSSSFSPPLSSTYAPRFSSTFAPPSFVQEDPYPTLYDRSPDIYSNKPYFGVEPRVDVNIKSQPPVTLTMTDDGQFVKDIRYKSNGLEVHYPYFEPTYNNHYFGEHTPPQLVWYPKRTNTVYNPVEFRNIPKATWKPSFWSYNVPASGYEHKHVAGAQTRCQCKNDVTPGLQWHPQRKSFNSGDPGTQINDKLAPLN